MECPSCKTLIEEPQASCPNCAEIFTSEFQGMLYMEKARVLCKDYEYRRALCELEKALELDSANPQIKELFEEINNKFIYIEKLFRKFDECLANRQYEEADIALQEMTQELPFDKEVRRRRELLKAITYTAFSSEEEVLPQSRPKSKPTPATKTKTKTETDISGSFINRQILSPRNFSIAAVILALILFTVDRSMVFLQEDKPARQLFAKLGAMASEQPPRVIEFIEAFEGLRQKFPDSSYARKAEERYRTMYDTFKSNLTIQIQRKLFEADTIFDSGNYEAAIQKWQEVLEIDPKNEVADYGIWRAKGKIYWAGK